MKKKRKNLIIILLVTICVLGYFFIRIINPTIRGVVIKTNNQNLTFMDVKDKELYNISIPQNNNLQYKQGQEILVHYKYDAIITHSLPIKIRTEDITKITILKEKSNAKIPREKLERIYNLGENVLITIDELSQTGISITINDKNEFKREYKHSDFYQILKGEDNGTYSELTRNNNIKTTVNSIKIDNDGTVKNTYNWENVYGKLESGEYKFKTSTLDYYMNIFIKFTIEENGKIIYSKPECSLMF